MTAQIGHARRGEPRCAAIGDVRGHGLFIGVEMVKPGAAKEPDEKRTVEVVNKLKDRGTHQAYGVVTNAQDFMHVLRFYVEKGTTA